ncbi:MAG TPA: hypothetical protein VF274_00450 [Alphaproteobacteria bacterium]
MPRYSLTGEKLASRGRLCHLTPADRQHFSRLLREMWPTGYFEDLLGGGQRPVRDSLADCGRYAGFNIPFAGRKPGGHGNWHYLHIYFQLCSLEPFDLSKPRPPYQLLLPDLDNPGKFVLKTVYDDRPTLDFKGRTLGRGDDISCVFRAADAKARAAAAKVFRLAGRLMTNAFERVELVSGRVVEHIPSSPDWAGPDTLRLCQEDRTVFTNVDFDRERGVWLGYRPVPKPTRR